MQRQAKINDKSRRFGVFMTPLSRRSKITEFAARCTTLLLHLAANSVILLLLDNGIMKTQKHLYLSLLFACLYISKALLIHLDSIESDSSPQSLKLLNSSLFLSERGIPYFGQSSPTTWNHQTTVCLVFWCAFLKVSQCCLPHDIVWCTCAQLNGLYDTFHIFHLLVA